MFFHFPPAASAQWQPDGLTIHTKKWFLETGFLGAPPIYLSAGDTGTRSECPVRSVLIVSVHIFSFRGSRIPEPLFTYSHFKMPFEGSNLPGAGPIFQDRTFEMGAARPIFQDRTFEMGAGSQLGPRSAFFFSSGRHSGKRSRLSDLKVTFE